MKISSDMVKYQRIGVKYRDQRRKPKECLTALIEHLQAAVRNFEVKSSERYDEQRKERKKRQKIFYMHSLVENIMASRTISGEKCR